MLVGIDARGAIWYRGTGIGTYTYQLLYHLKKRPESNNYRLFWPGEEFVGLDICCRDVFEKIEASQNYWEEYFLPQQLAHEKINVYHVPQNGIGLPMKKECKQVVTVHDLIPYIYPETVGKGYLKIFMTEMPRIMENADRIITVSKCSKKDIENIFGYPGEKIDVIYEAPEPIYAPGDKTQCREFLAAKYGITEDFVLYVGGFSPRKNVKGLLTAYAEVIKELEKKFLLVLPGKRNKEFDQIDAMINVLNLQDRVIFPGFVPVQHLPYFYQGASVFVYPSFYEGFGLPPLEAMSCATPTIVANTSSLPEVVGKSAVLFNPYDTLDLAEKMLKILLEPEWAHFLSKKALNRAKKYSWSKVAEETASVYQKTVSAF
ncbi:MAG: glycosyltransferase family 4 protein [Bacillota bacterium]